MSTTKLLFCWIALLITIFATHPAHAKNISATHQGPEYYSANQLITINVEISFSVTLTALGMNVELPEDWTYVERAGINPSEITKVKGNSVSFAWINNLDPDTFTFYYDIRTSEKINTHKSIYATILYREGDSGELKKTVLPAPLQLEVDKDNDGDGVTNSQDAFPDDPTETLDTDKDKIGNNADTDDDNDDMPDTWEIEHGLDPLTPNANDDNDSDGISNFDEFKNQTPPSNFLPSKPEIVSPSHNLTNVSLSPKLISGAFDDQNESDALHFSDWQVSLDSDFKQMIFQHNQEGDQRQIQLPDLVLESDTAYYWRVRYCDNYNECSEWSEAHFRTCLDTNSTNGIPNDQQVDPYTDLDDNDEYDNEQNSIKSFESLVGDVQIGIKSDSPSAYTISSAKSVDPSAITETFNRPDEMPFGMITFKINLATKGNSTKLYVYYSSPLPEDALWYTYDIKTGWSADKPVLSEDRKVVTLFLTDGGDGDADGLVNGIIIDPAGPGISSSSSTQHPTPQLIEVEDIDNGSCFIDLIKN